MVIIKDGEIEQAVKVEEKLPVRGLKEGLEEAILEQSFEEMDLLEVDDEELVGDTKIKQIRREFDFMETKALGFGKPARPFDE
jgi:hypothetical protein